MGVVAILLVGLTVAAVQIVVDGLRPAERAHVIALGMLAAFFGGSLAQAIAAESLATVSVGSLAGAAVLSGLVLTGWRAVALRPQALLQRDD